MTCERPDLAWLEKHIKEASAEVAQWPAWKRLASTLAKRETHVARAVTR